MFYDAVAMAAKYSTSLGLALVSISRQQMLLQYHIIEYPQIYAGFLRRCCLRYKP
jgi:hypothetical protein